ncbi:MAG: RNA-binding protein [Pseudomonadota bacterium]
MSARSRQHVRTDGADRPMRTCIASRQARAPDELIRFALSPQGILTPDLANALPGRGAWVTCSKDCIKTALEKRAFDRAFRRSVDVPDDFLALLERLLTDRALQSLSLAKKAGSVITGFTKVNSAIETAAVDVLVQASDASLDGKKRIAGKYKAICEELAIEPKTINLFSIEQLSLAIGRPNVVHAALNHGRVADEFILAARRLSSFLLLLDDANPSANAAIGATSPSESANDLGLETEQA